MANAERGSIARKRCRLAISAPRLFCLDERRFLSPAFVNKGLDDVSLPRMRYPTPLLESSIKNDAITPSPLRSARSTLRCSFPAARSASDSSAPWRGRGASRRRIALAFPCARRCTRSPAVLFSAALESAIMDESYPLAGWQPP